MILQVKYLDVPTEEQRERARKSVKATVESIARDVQHMIEWNEKQPHLPDFRDEDILAHSLLQCKNSLEKTKRRLEKYSNVRALFPEIFRDRNPHEKWFEDQKNFAYNNLINSSKTEAAQPKKKVMFLPSRKLTPDGYRLVMLYLTDDSKMAVPPPENFLKMTQMTIELTAKIDYNRGVILIIDFANFRMPLLTLVTSNLQKFFLLTQGATPISYKKIYLFNMVAGANTILTIAKTLIKKKLAKRIEILKNSTDLCKVFPKEIIPKDYKGDELPLKELKDLWFEEMRNNYDFIKSTDNFATDLSKLPKDYLITELSGMPGSFRQISID